MAATNREILFVIKMRNATRGELNSLRQAFRSLSSDANNATKGMQAYVRAINAASAAAARLNAATSKARLPQGGANNRGAFNIGGAVAGVAAFVSLDVIKDAADTYKNLAGVISLTVETEREQVEVQRQLLGIANDTRQALEPTVDLYGRMARASANMAVSTQDLIGATETVNQAILLSRASTAAATASLIQLGQALGSDRLGGDELRSIAEQTPRLAQAIVEGLDKALIGGQSRTIATLKKLGAEGKLTAEVVFKAIQNQSARLASEFGKVPLTIGQSMNVLRNEFIDFIGNADRASAVSSALASGIVALAKNIDIAAAAFVTLAGGTALRFVVDLMRDLGAIVIDVGRSIKALFGKGSVLLNPWVALAAVIAVVVTALYTFRNEFITVGGHAARLRDWLGAVGDVIKDRLMPVWNLLVLGFQKARDFLSSLGIDWEKTFKTLFEITKAFVNFYIGIYPAMYHAAQNGLELIVAAFKDAWNYIKDNFGKFFDALVAVREGDLTKAAEIWQSAFTQSFDQTKASFKDMMATIRSDLTADYVGGVIDEIGERAAQRRREAAKLARINAERAAYDQQALDAVRPSTGGGSEANDKEAKKFADRFQSLQDKLAPVLQRLREYREAVAMINKAEADGLINKTMQDYLLEQAELKLGANTSVMGEFNKTLAENARLIGLTSNQREIESAIMDLENKLLQEGNMLTDDARQATLDLARAKLTEQQVSTDLAQINQQTKDQIRDLQQKTALLGLSTAEQEKQAAIQALQNQLDDAGVTNLQDKAKLIADLTAALDANKASQDGLNASFEYGFKSAFQEFAENAKNIAGSVKDAWTKALGGTADAITDLITTGKADFKSLVDSLIRDLIRMQVVKWIGKGIDFIGGLGGVDTSTQIAHTGAFAGASRATKNVDPMVFATAKRYHSGGLIGSEVPIVAERGEAIMPTVRMSNGELGVRTTGGMGGGQSVFAPTIQVSVNGGSSGNAPQDEKLGQLVAQMVEEQMRALMDDWAVQNMRPNGVFNRGMNL